MAHAPVFSLESVNALVPRLNVVLAEQFGRRGRIEAKLAALAAMTGDAPDDLDPEAADPTDVASLRAETKELVVEYRAAWQELEDLGAVVKDPRTGLLDFYGHVEGKLVWLCWKYGETEVSHYHGLDEGFRGRKALVGVKHRLVN